MTEPTPFPSLQRRLAAIVYDLLLLWGVLFVSGLPLPLIPDHIRETWWVELATLAYLILVSFLFFGWFWVHGGQTLGLRAWRMRIANPDGTPISWRSALARFFGAILSWVPLGLGYGWIVFDSEKKAWHDRLSNTVVFLIPKKKQ